ncbi:GxGYxYP domain-containing protein [Aquisphaera insulae]|uniref:GxGYxYP domain-containing protein n=1 Tax=Aquisphaera insulae TaxID=2712864 RepID=UPI0013EB58E5|nr:GxGYxYP domain-containing protein [Aquisphaera insulae]
MPARLSTLVMFACAFGWSIGVATAAPPRGEEAPLVACTLSAKADAASYDEAMATASIQGIVNRRGPKLYVLSAANPRPKYWLDLFRKDGGWLAGRRLEEASGLDALVKLAGDDLRGAVIWDPNVPATVNVATTIAGVEDAVVLSPELAAANLSRWKLKVIRDLRGMFDGKETGSRKNDAYRWAIREYLAPGKCSNHRLFLDEDAAVTRAAGKIGDVVTRDWAVANRAFVLDLSPWGDEPPADDTSQTLGTDLETYRMILETVFRNAGGKELTELSGFFAFHKYSNVPGHPSAHDPVPTEWETVWLISPYNGYQNTVTGDCFNQSLHSQAPRKPLRQQPAASGKPLSLSNTSYLAFFMADYDSTMPLYEILPPRWDAPERGKLPLAWGINPNLLETYPDIIAHYYATATPNDTFTSDASAAGYMNPNRIRPDQLPLFVEHNRRLFREAGMTIAPMVLDWDQPSPAVKDAFREFSPDGFATIVMDLHGKGGKPPAPQLWKGMPVTELISEPWDFTQSAGAADMIHARLAKRPAGAPAFFLNRVVWVTPADVIRCVEELRKRHPEDRFELVDIRTFFRLFREDQQRRGH